MENDDVKSMLGKVHKRVIDEMLRRENPGGSTAKMEKVIQADQRLRKAVAELFLSLEEAGNQAAAVDILSEHTAILVEMINRFKK